MESAGSRTFFFAIFDIFIEVQSHCMADSTKLAHKSSYKACQQHKQLHKELEPPRDRALTGVLYDVVDVFSAVWQVHHLASDIMATSHCIKRNWQNWAVSRRKTGLFVWQRNFSERLSKPIFSFCHFLFLWKAILSYYFSNYTPFSVSDRLLSSIFLAFFLLRCSFPTPQRTRCH